MQRQDSAITTKKGQADDVRPQTIPAEVGGLVSNRTTSITRQNTNSLNNAANETKDAITSRIIHTVNMMKEVLQGNLGLRETIQK